jgi:hypothetical protein
VSTIEQLAHQVVPAADIGDLAASDRALRTYNVAGVFREVAAARTAVTQLENVAGDGVHVQFVSFGQSTRTDAGEKGRVDPGGVTALAARRSVLGGVVGGGIGAVVFGGATYLMTDDAGMAAAAAVAAGLILGVVGGLFANFARFGAGDAWRQTFQAHDPPASLVAVLSDGRDAVEPSADVLRSNGAVAVYVVDQDGRPIC